MTSGNFHRIPLSQIIINRETRQRRDLIQIPELAESIGRLGLIHPIVVTRDLILVAGERRLAAHAHLGLPDIMCQYTDEIEPSQLRALELEENVKRCQLSWQDEVRAIQEFHAIRAIEPDWSQRDTAAALGLDPVTVSNKLAVAQEIERGNEAVISAPKYSVARGITERKVARAADSALSTIRAIHAAPEEHHEQPPQTILNQSFIEWARSYDGPRFNFIHCDFPYGIGAGDFNQGGAAAHGGYEDSAETYWSLCRELAGNLDRIATDSAHIMFWFSMRYYQQTLDFFARETDFKLNYMPLIWTKTDNSGILPDYNRGPRQIYETCLFGSRGDRPIVRAVSNSYGAPSVKGRHISEKSESMLRYFMGMFVDEHSTVLDPTCGSGSALRAADSLGAQTVCGLELNSDYAAIAEHIFQTARARRKPPSAAAS